MSLVAGPVTRPLLDDSAAASGVDLEVHAGTSVDRNSREMLEGRYDIAEMSLATFVKARELGAELIGLPAFTGRRFLQPCVVARSASGIRTLADLRGKRIGLPQFWMTSSVWHRGLLHQEASVAQEDVVWHTSTPERLMGLQIPEGAQVRPIPAGADLEALLISGELDALMTPRSHEPLVRQHPELLLPYGDDVAETTVKQLEQTGVFPIMHLVVLTGAVVREHPDLPAALFARFVQAKARALSAGAFPELPEGASRARFERVLGKDPWPYGVRPGRAALEVFLQFGRAQGLISQPMFVEDLFEPSTLHLAG